MRIEQKTLNNQLETLFVNLPGSTVGTVQIWFRAGSSFEDQGDEGVAHFLEHMFFKGTQKRPGHQIAHEVESFGGEINAFTSFDYTCYYINAPSNHLNEAAEILLDMVSNPEFLESELIPERGVVLEEYRRSIDSASQYHFSQIQKNCFSGKYNHQILGNENTIKNFTRDQLIKFRSRYYNQSNALFVVGGALDDSKHLTQIIEQYKLPQGPKAETFKFKLKKASPIAIHEKDVSQVSLSLTIEAPDFEDHNAAKEDLALNVFGHGAISPFYRRLVTETSLATSASASTMFFNGGGAHFIKIICPISHFSKCMDETYKILRDFYKEKIDQEQIDRIKNQYIASKIYEKESLESFVFSMGHGFAQNGDIHCEEKFIDEIRKVNPVNVMEGIKNIFSRKIHVNIQVPNENKESIEIQRIEKFIEKINHLSQKQRTQKSKLKTTESSFDPMAKLYDIKKGVQLFYRQSHVTPTFTLHAYLKGGLAHETMETNGHYHMLAKMISNGFKGSPYEKLKFELDSKAAYLNGFSGKNAVGLTLHGQSDHFERLCEIFIGSLLNPSFPANHLKIEKELSKRSIEMAQKDPIKQCFKSFNQTIFEGHPYAMDTIGNNDSIHKISRKKLQDLHLKIVEKSPLLITYCGDKEVEEVLEKLAPLFENLKPRSQVTKRSKKLKSPKGKKISLPFEREQTQILIGRPAFSSGKKEDLYLKMLTSYLSGQSSELFVDVRDKKGLCYAVQPLHHTALEGGYWGIYIGAGNDKKDLAINAILDLLAKLAEEGLDQENFERIKKMIDGQNQLSVQTIEDYANFYSIAVLHNMGLDFQHQSFEQIRQFSLEEFNGFLGHFLNYQWNIVEAGQ